MNIEEIKNEVIYSESQNRLFEISIELTEELSRLHRELVNSKDNWTKVEIKGSIALLSTIQNIIDKRIDNVIADERDFERKRDRKELMSNRQFRIAAETVLTKETYERILELSLNYKKLKDQKQELKANKLE